jgi:hypothetical protein
MNVAATQVSKEIDAKIYAIAREAYQEGKKTGKETIPEIRTMVSGAMDDCTPTSLMVKIVPNPINARLSSGWKVVAESRVWEIPATEIERSRLL